MAEAATSLGSLMSEEAAGPIEGAAGGLFSHGDYTAANCSSFALGGCGSYPSGVCRSHVSTKRMFHTWFLYSAGEEQPPGHSHVPHGRGHWAALAPTARRMPFFVRHACSPLYTSRSTS